MRAYEFQTFNAAIEQVKYQLLYRSKLVHSDHWQGVDIRNKPEMATREVAHISFAVPMIHDTLQYYQMDIQPNLPWADDHFHERVCGYPINPGTTWKSWPYGHSAEKFLDNRGMFNHNYMERYWPKIAGFINAPVSTAEQYATAVRLKGNYDINRGIMYEYGDLYDVVQLLATDPYTRQAYLPVWFPEDTGGGAKRAPCTLGYHFLMRGDRLDIDYHIRSCDFVRHFRDDIYLTVRLALWMIDACRRLNKDWEKVRPGKFIMHIGSLHVFVNDFAGLK